MASLVARLARGSLAQRFVSSGKRSFSTQASELMDAEIEHATGLEKEQLQAEKRGVDLFHEKWYVLDSCSFARTARLSDNELSLTTNSL